jgi:hypothetical protein
MLGGSHVRGSTYRLVRPGPGTGGARPRASSYFEGTTRYSVRWSALCVALWAARDLVKNDRVRDGETTQSGLDPPAVTVDGNSRRARAVARDAPSETTCDRGDPAITVETPPACLCSPPQSPNERSSAKRPPVRESDGAGGGPRSAQVVRVRSVSCGSAPGRGTLSTPRSTCCHASLGCRHASLLGGAGSSLRGRSRRP